MMANKNKQRRENKKPKKERQNKKMTNQADFTKGKQMAFCHKGNSIVYFNDETETALVIGGWKNNAVYDQDTFVIDLTGDEDKYGNTPKAYGDDAEKLMKIVSNSHAGWLSLPFPDYQTPKNMTTTEQWYSMAEGIKEILDSGKNVLVACLGGHGRSGLFCAIVGYILNSGVGWESPVDKIRGIHCSLAIETEQQEQFVYDILGLDLVANSSDYWTAYDNFSYGTSLTSGNSNPCPKCGTESLYIHSNGMCLSCQDKAKKNQAPIMDISTEALMRVKCECGKKNCLGTWVAEKCEHAVHDQLVIDGYCEKCTEANQEAEEKMAEVEKKTKKTKKGCGCSTRSTTTTPITDSY